MSVRVPSGRLKESSSDADLRLVGPDLEELEVDQLVVDQAVLAARLFFALLPTQWLALPDPGPSQRAPSAQHDYPFC